MQKNSFIAYEYLTQTVSPSMQATYVDGYANFGWQLQESKEGLHGVTLAFKRDRSITHKSELNRLQKQFEQQMAHVVRLEKSKQSSATSEPVDRHRWHSIHGWLGFCLGGRIDFAIGYVSYSRFSCLGKCLFCLPLVAGPPFGKN